MTTIKAKKFILRSIEKDDAENIAKYANDKVVYRNTLVIPYPYRLKDAEDWIKQNLKRYKEKNPENFVLAIDIDGEFAGAIGIHNIREGHKAELGYWLGRKFWGRGIMTEAVKEISQLAFKKFGLRRCYAHVFTWNKASARVLEKSGFKFEGTLKKDAKKNGKFLDHHVFARVK